MEGLYLLRIKSKFNYTELPDLEFIDIANNPSL